MFDSVCDISITTVRMVVDKEKLCTLTLKVPLDLNV